MTTPDLLALLAAVSAAFTWAMDNQGEALRRACEEVDVEVLRAMRRAVKRTILEEVL